MLHFMYVIGRFMLRLMIVEITYHSLSPCPPSVPTGGFLSHGDIGEIAKLVTESASVLAQVLFVQLLLFTLAAFKSHSPRQQSQTSSISSRVEKVLPPPQFWFVCFMSLVANLHMVIFVLVSLRNPMTRLLRPKVQQAHGFILHAACFVFFFSNSQRL